MLRQLMEHMASARDLSEQLRLLQEITAYVMQTGPRGGRFYYTPKGRKVYRELKKRRDTQAISSRALAQEWDAFLEDDVRTRTGMTRGEAIAVNAKQLFGEEHAKKFTPDFVKSMFSTPGLNPKSLSVTPDAFSSQIHVHLDISDSEGKVIGKQSRTFTTSSGAPKVYHALFTLKEEYQGGGRAGALFSKALKGYQKLGIKKIGVSAALSTGPYAWARFGFKPNEYTLHEMKNDFTEFALDRLPLNEKQTKSLLNRVKSSHDLSGLKIQRTVKDPDTGEKKKITIPVGKQFLLNSNGGRPYPWSGECDLTDPKQLKIFKAQCKKGEEQRKKAIAEGKADASIPKTVLGKRQTQARMWQDVFARTESAPAPSAGAFSSFFTPPEPSRKPKKLSAQAWYEADKAAKAA